MAEIEKESPAENTHLSEEELEHFKEKLLQEKEEAENKIEEIKANLDDLNQNFDDTKSSQDHHHGNLATEEDAKLTYMSQLEQNQDKLDQITVALDRIGTGDYGICIETGQPIQKERLETMPYALRTVGAKS
ncbi:MAG: TraR/DksA C4-type zinc finger protein [Balneolaceae bacterium]|nr:TraR/DksA C4-type zinc finger protein [Balneolaceae bacterium]